ncbi:MAG: type II methionyl aminopeptidase [Ignisphaera sp.]|uniref:Methionine aminopeptidase n=1 Tax=Ignisphaera aggregans TaxID=334771 RepID=A0A7C4NNX0_9CREN
MSFLSEEDIKNYVNAGKIACLVMKEVEQFAKVGVKIIDLAEFVERRIRDLNGEIAFPVNISVNSVAAHYTPIPNDLQVLSEDSVVKIDIGVHVAGCIADTATTIALSDKYRLLTEAVKHALEKALTFVAPGRRFSEVGNVIEKIIKDYGFKPIYNLSGHKIDRFTIHAGETIPNFNDRLNLGKFKSGSIYALEPFATNGSGYVMESSIATIYALKYNPKKIRGLSKDVGEFYSHVYNSRKGLPFAKRWYINRFGEPQLNKILDELHKNNLLMIYPVLVEKSNGIVTQFEHTILIDNKGNAMVITEQC